MFNIWPETPGFVVPVIYGLLAYFTFSNLCFLLLLSASFFSIRRVLKVRPMVDSLRNRSAIIAPPISVIAPAFNEEMSMVESALSFLLLDYPRHEVIVVNDGSTDQTMELMKSSYDLEETYLFYDHRLSKAKIRGVYISKRYPNLIVIDKENGGKADAINVGIGFAKYDLFCTVDSDSILDVDALLKAVVPFIEDPDNTIASGGTVRPVNGCTVRSGRVVEQRLPKNLLALVQVVEYLRAFLFGRVGWNVLDATLIISGAFGIFKKSAAIEVGGYRNGALSEDMELIVRLRRIFGEQNKPVKISFVPDPICWTEVPSDFRTLRRQRDRWQRGLTETLVENRSMFLNPRYGVVGFVAFPYFFIVELLGPLMDFLAYTLVTVGYFMGWVQLELVVLFFIVDILYGILMSFGAVLIEESAYHRYPKFIQLLLLIFLALVENLGYRQFNSFWRLIGLARYFLGDKDWGKMKRAGFSPQT